jgi:hypothetical protein
MNDSLILRLSNQSQIACELKLWDAINQFNAVYLPDGSWCCDGVTISSVSNGHTYRELLFTSMNSPFYVSDIRLHSDEQNWLMTVPNLTLFQKDASGRVKSRVLERDHIFKPNDDIMFTGPRFIVDGFTLITFSMVPQSTHLIEFLRNDHFK